MGHPSTVDIVKTYKECEVLWNPKHCDYRNKSKRKDCFKIIKEKFGFSSIDLVKKKLKSIRDTFTAEKNKMIKFDSYKTKLIWYDLANSFISIHGPRKYNRVKKRLPQCTQFRSIPSVIKQDNYQETLQTLNFKSSPIIDDDNNIPEDQQISHVYDIYIESSDNAEKTTEEIPPATSKKRKKEKDELPRYISEAIKKLEELKNSATRDEYYYFGQNIACQLRAIPKSHALQIQSDIQSLILKKRVDLLAEDSCLTL